MSYLNVVADISHYQRKVDFSVAKKTIRGVIIKATQGLTNVDSTFDEHFADAQAEKLLVGTYHFGEFASGKDQADFYLDTIGSGRDLPMALDFETWKKKGKPQTPMSLQQAREFVSRIHEKTGRWPGIYGSNYLKEQVGNQRDDILSNCWLWLAEYGPTPKWPKKVWSNWTFWQYTADGDGPLPHDVPGIGSNVCRDNFVGTEQELEAFFRSGGAASPGSPLALTATREVAAMPGIDQFTDFLGTTLEKLTEAGTAAKSDGKPWLFPDGIRHISLSVTLPSSFSVVVSGAPKDEGAGSSLKGAKEAAQATSDNPEDPGAEPGSEPTEAEIQAANFGVDGRGDFPEGDPGVNIVAAASTTKKTIQFDVKEAWKFLEACENSHPRVHYKLGAKIKPGQEPGKDFTAVDCSGFVREVVRRSTNLGSSFPDGSVVQHDWVRKKGFALTTWNDACNSDDQVRIAFLSPNDSGEHIGHVLLINNGKTIESHGGLGPDSRTWKDLSFSKKMEVYLLT